MSRREAERTQRGFASRISRLYWQILLLPLLPPPPTFPLPSSITLPFAYVTLRKHWYYLSLTFRACASLIQTASPCSHHLHPDSQIPYWLLLTFAWASSRSVYTATERRYQSIFVRSSGASCRSLICFVIFLAGREWRAVLLDVTVVVCWCWF